MLLNQDVALSTPAVLLVPYEPHHVPEYHGWMQRPELQELTASEPLSMEEEYSMQASWRGDTDKLTFIICLPFASAATPTTRETEKDEEGEIPDAVRGGTDDASDQMIGDINLFVSEDPDAAASSPLRLVGELEIMIAQPGATGQGRGRAAVLAFLRYVYDHQAEICSTYAAGKGLRESLQAPSRLDYLRVKVAHDNTKSIGLFQSLGFAGDGQQSVFGEIELRLQSDFGEALKAWNSRWPGSVSSVQELPYEREFSVQVEQGEEPEDTEMAG